MWRIRHNEEIYKLNVAAALSTFLHPKAQKWCGQVVWMSDSGGGFGGRRPVGKIGGCCQRDGLDLIQVQNWKAAARNTTLEAEDKGGHSLPTGQSTTEEEEEEEKEEEKEEEEEEEVEEKETL